MGKNIDKLERSQRKMIRIVMANLPAAALLMTGTLIPSVLYSAPPLWWIERGLLVDQVRDDFAVLNQGQLKNAVAACVAEMNTVLPGGAGADLNNLVGAWRNPQTPPHDFSAVNLGQVKAVLKLVYDRLNTVHGTAGYYPWNGGTADNGAAANLGQLKRLLNLDMNQPPNVPRTDAHFGKDRVDTDGDGLPDWFEVLIGTDPGNADSDGDGTPDGMEDHDSDGLSNRAEYLIETMTPSGNDADGDGVSDADEAGLGTSPSGADTDGDGFTDGEERAQGSDPSDADSTPLIQLQITTPQR